MDYVVGSVAALITGNVTPNRPKISKRALTPKKHQTSPNITPKCEVDDRSIFLSPTLQKKKDIVKKSPKRIFQNPDLEVTNDGEEISPLISPKTDKVKKHLKNELEAEDVANTSFENTMSSKKEKKKSNNSERNQNNDISIEIQNNESTPKKNKKQRNFVTLPTEEEKSDKGKSEKMIETESLAVNKSLKKKRKSGVSEENITLETVNDINQQTAKKKRINKKSISTEPAAATPQTSKLNDNQVTDQNEQTKNKKRNKKKKKNNQKQKSESLKLENKTLEQETETITQEEPSKKKSKKDKNVVNPNAITNEDSESEHESDDDIESENDINNKEVLDTGSVEESSDEEDAEQKKLETKEEKTSENKEEELNRTLFVGNVLFNKKCKKEIKKIFSKYGHIETVRIRTIPVKDARVTPKLAIIKNELHPDRTTVNVYVKFQDPSSVDKALVENNKKLNDHHLRVTRSDSSGALHDPRHALFVGNLPFAIEDDTLRTKFEKCGEIVSVRIIRDRKTNAGKGFGYVNFASKDGVELALSMSEEDLTIKNRIIRVKRCSVNPKARTNQVQKSDNRPNNQAFNRTDNRSGNRMDNRSGNRMDNRSGNRMDNRFGNRMDNRSGNRMDNRFGNRMDNRSGNRMGNNGFQSRPQQSEGAFRRIANKRQNEEGNGGPPNKMARTIMQPNKEKKTRKEFVGMTSEKKKKHTFSKGQKKKKVLGEILTK